MSAEETRRRGLGRGLSALLGEEAGDMPTAAPEARAPRSVPVELIHPGRYQPRHQFDPEQLQALAESIKAQGILQPLLVRPHPDLPGHFEIVAGERRWRAAQAAQLHEVPVVLRELGEREALEIALVENVQRQDLNPLEEAEGYRRLIDEFQHTQEDLARALGKSRSHVANLLRLLSLPEEVQALVRDGKISAGHARALIGVEEAPHFAREIVKHGFNVRQVERMVQMLAKQKEKKSGAPVASLAGPRDADTALLEREITQLLGLKVQIVFHRGKGGMLSIHYETLDQLDDVLRRLHNSAPARGFS